MKRLVLFAAIVSLAACKKEEAAHVDSTPAAAAVAPTPALDSAARADSIRKADSIKAADSAAAATHK